MPDEAATRVQLVPGLEPTIEVIKTVVEKTQHKESALLREKAYFEEMKAKADAGIARVTSLLAQLHEGSV